MKQVPSDQLQWLAEWFRPERPGLGPLIGQHILQTGNGNCYVDTWPHPRLVLAQVAGNCFLTGHHQASKPNDLQGHLSGFVKTSAELRAAVRAAFPMATPWERVLLELHTEPPALHSQHALVRRLDAGDAVALARLSAESAWITRTWSSPAGLAGSGYAWGAFAGAQLVAVACTFFVGTEYEEIGVVTEPAFQGLGLSSACAGALCNDIISRGHVLSWSTSPDNAASLRVARKLGFSNEQPDRVYAIGVPIPKAPPRRT